MSVEKHPKKKITEADKKVLKKVAEDIDELISKTKKRISHYQQELSHSH